MDPLVLGGLILGGINLISGLLSANEASRQASAQEEAMRRQEGAAYQYGVELSNFREQLLNGLRELFPDNPEWLKALQNPESLHVQALQKPEWLQNSEAAALARTAAAVASRTAHDALMPYFSKLQGRALQGIRAIAGASGLTGSGLEAAAASQAIGDINAGIAQRLMEYDTARMQALNQAAATLARLQESMLGIRADLAKSAAQLANQYYLTRGNSLMDAYRLIANTLASQYGMQTNVYGQHAGLRGDNARTYAAMGPDMSWLPPLLMLMNKGA